MIYSIEDLINVYEKGERRKFIFFWGHTPLPDGSINQSCFSQWWNCHFVVDGESYSCAEQFMMAEKARLFGDKAMLKAIMNARHPKEMKDFGRLVKSFNWAIWESRCYEIVKRGNFAKFEQNSDLWNYMKTTKNRILVEASPVDPIWGIGLAKDNPDVENPLKWKGRNLLGFALTEVRDQLLQSSKG
ncbi:NADAR family protein [Paenibacillus sp. BSR1-1]|uniref:NADAR family protein n=1 Tax=Paenibacillus sp. BSR1-1 TaxID=3020845 RepID=UPI0025B00847|nr:NADAR family protein [Paenibacillus sp. BSR1-1]MDN3019940.1 NADAR family protein [Paenibacillus sp. BSR1-1]